MTAPIKLPIISHEIRMRKEKQLRKQIEWVKRNVFNRITMSHRNWENIQKLEAEDLIKP